MRAWNTLKAGYHWGRSIWVAFDLTFPAVGGITAGIVADGLIEVIVIISAVTAMAILHQNMRRDLRDSEMVRKAWERDAARVQSELFAERMHSLKLTQANIKLSQQVADLTRPDYHANGETK